jgi:murein DD-endopeptidase MepM/ murein hydrolase activator NlpD
MNNATKLRTIWARQSAHVLPAEFYGTPWLALDLSRENKNLPATGLSEVLSLGPLISSWIHSAGCRVGYGGHNEPRAWYQASDHFSGPNGPRSIHFGVDIWVPPGTPILASWNGVVHSFKDNNNFLDYGPTIILQHQSEGLTWHSLHGHLSRSSLQGLVVGQSVTAGQVIGAIGQSTENGSWIPHLHFQLILDMQGYEGDYPAISTPADRSKFIENCPDPEWLLKPTLIRQEQSSILSNQLV